MNKEKLRKFKLSEEKVLPTIGFVLFLILIGLAAYIIIFLNNTILPVFQSNSTSTNNGVHFDFEKYESLNL